MAVTPAALPPAPLPEAGEQETKISLIGEYYRPEEEESEEEEEEEVVIVQRCSLIVQDGVWTQETETQIIDPVSIRNVDGQARQRKGSSRISKKLGDRRSSGGQLEDTAGAV